MNIAKILLPAYIAAMPIYEFHCQKCGADSELLDSFPPLEGYALPEMRFHQTVQETVRLCLRRRRAILRAVLLHRQSKFLRHVRHRPAPFPLSLFAGRNVKRTSARFLNMPAKLKPPTESELKAALGSAGDLWHGIVHALEERFAPLDQQWKPSKTGFGRLCLLQHKKRTLLYITPDKDKVWIAVVLGERAFGLALASSLPAAIKKMFSEARPYAEGRGIRFPATSLSDIPTIAELVEIKTTPK